MAAGLQRSSETFRRSGSSGLVWEDRFLTDELKQQIKPAAGADGDHEFREMKHSKSVGPILQHSRSCGGGGGHGCRTGRESPPLDPPSPKLSGCGFCGIFGMQETASNKPNCKPRK